MVGVLKRMTQLKTLLSIRLGPGAAKLPPEVTRIHLDFGVKTTDGHGGAAKFLRQTLPRLKYHNPSLPITVNRTKDQEGPAILTIHFTTPDAASSAPQISSTTSSTTSTGPVAQTTPAAPVVRTETIHMKHRHKSEILQQVMAITKATVVLPTPEEEADIEELKRKKIESEKVSLKSKQATEARKRAEAIVLQARNATTAASAAAV